ncbi:Ig kappa chain V-I region Walker precursor [Triplophysa rosa]|uniref:Ig kappa chain V-I region Walker n=1 Tax=Triplophysa rosa TaxID=992332 RepID=A0A9W7TWE8_TRIRA|nr:Ig kappa chain V-I region Walker precursor [Triplophysa rosa]
MTFIVCLIYFTKMPLWVSGKSLSDQVHQTPAHLLTKVESTVQLNCSHTIQDYYMILWYEQLKSDTALRLIGYVNYKNPSIENDFKNQYNIAGDGAKASTLHLKLENKPVGSTAMYYCAASKAQ